MSADIIHNAEFPHGTPEGYTRGCHGSHCPAPMSCRVVHTRYNGDWAFRKQIDAGVTLAEIIAGESPTPPARVRKPSQAPTAAVRRVRAPQGQHASVHATQVRELHGEGLLDKEIADRIGLCRRQVTTIRDALKLPPHRGIDAEQVRALHGEGLTDRQITDRINQTRARKTDRRAIWGVRNRLGLTPNQAPATTGASS